MNQHDQMMRDALRMYMSAGSGNSTDFDIQARAWSMAYQAFSHVNETPKNEHDSGDVLNKPGNVDAMRDALQGLIDFIEIDNLPVNIDAMRIAKQALTAEPAPLVKLTASQLLEAYMQGRENHGSNVRQAIHISGLEAVQKAIQDAMQRANK